MRKESVNRQALRSIKTEQHTFGCTGTHCDEHLSGEKGEPDGQRGCGFVRGLPIPKSNSNLKPDPKTKP